MDDLDTYTKRLCEPCECEFDPYDDCDEESTHYLRTCRKCNHQWYGLHCPHDLYQNPCSKCGTRPKPHFELVRDLIEPMFRAKQRDLRLWEMRLNEYLRSILPEKSISQ